MSLQKSTFGLPYFLEYTTRTLVYSVDGIIPRRVYEQYNNRPGLTIAPPSFHMKTTADETYQHVNKNLDENFVSANVFVISSPAKHTGLKSASISRQTTALSAADWEAALLPADLE